MKTLQADTIEGKNPHKSVNEEWLALTREDVVEPDLPVIDTHHHLWDRAHNRYMFDQLLADTRCGHQVRSTVFVECGAMYRSSGPRELRPVGETEFVNGIAAMFASGAYGSTGPCSGIVGFADLLLGDRVKGVLEAQIAAAGGRFRGIRNVAAWHPDEAFVRSITFYRAPGGMFADPQFQEGFRHLAPLGLSFDTFLFHTQLPELYQLARDFPDTAIVLNHFGGPVKIGPYKGREQEVFRDWARDLRKLASCPNVHLKISGLTVSISGLNYHDRPVPPGSAELAAAWRDYFDVSLEAFGADRCMFGTNFPVDKGSAAPRIVWNALKRLARGCSADEKAALCSGTARSVYRLPEPA